MAAERLSPPLPCATPAIRRAGGATGRAGDGDESQLDVRAGRASIGRRAAKRDGNVRLSVRVSVTSVRRLAADRRDRLRRRPAVKRRRNDARQL